MESAHQPSLLGLPQDLRCRILRFALLRPCPISLTTEGKTIAERQAVAQSLIMKGDQCVYKMKGGGRMVFRKSGGLDCFCAASPVSLFRVCRLIHDESMPVFYEKNKFKLLGRCPADLRLFLRLAPRAVASLTSLLIRLNCYPCVLGHDDMDTKGQCLFCGSREYYSDQLLTDAEPMDRKMLDQWRRVCSYLAQSIQPGRLSLTLICDTEYEAAAKAVVEPLLTLPRLKKCTIRLGRQRNSALEDIARQACSQAMGHSTQTIPFRFFDLPRELRLRILEFTDLGVKHKDESICIVNGKRINKVSQRNQHRTCCWRCNDTRDNCCCPTVYAATSIDCVCRLVPLELFSVNRMMRIESEKVFFSMNCFEFDQTPLQSRAYSFSVNCFEFDQALLQSRAYSDAFGLLPRTLDFLRGLNSNAVKSIRRIRIVFDDSPIKNWDYTLKDRWRRLVEFIKENLTITNLCLTITMKETNERRLNPSSKTHQRLVYDAYHEIVRQLQILQGLRDLHLEFSWFQDLEAPLERYLMGPYYNSLEGNKFSKRPRSLRYPESQTMILRQVNGSDLPAWLVSAEFQHDYQKGSQAPQWDLESLLAEKYRKGWE